MQLAPRRSGSYVSCCFRLVPWHLVWRAFRSMQFRLSRTSETGDKSQAHTPQRLGWLAFGRKTYTTIQPPNVGRFDEQ